MMNPTSGTISRKSRRADADAVRARASALVVTLAVLALVTILSVGMFSVVRLERVSARRVLDATNARLLSDMAADHALSLIRDAISAAEATVPAATAGERRFWVSQPGRITVFHADGSVDADATRELYSTASDPDAPTVDLNAAPFGGTHPILTDGGTGAAPVLAVPWINVIADPSAPVSATNPIVGRYAFWVDDETTKININTADGTGKGTDASFGAGTPAEVSLEALLTNSGTLSRAEAEAIAIRSGARYEAGASTRPFNSVREIPQAGALPAEVYERNFQDLSAYNRAPDLNLFGEPKIYLATAIPSADLSTNTNPGRLAKGASTPLSLLTGPYAAIDPNPAVKPGMSSFYPLIQETARPLNWAYPSSGKGVANSQLPAWQYISQGDTKTTTVHLPQFFRDDLQIYVAASQAYLDHPARGYPDGSLDYEMGMRIARYLKGWNSQGQPIRWPGFPGSGTGGFAAKYTDRQIDDITVQILSLLKQTHIDHYYNYTLPYYMPWGFISGKPVRGASRGPRLTEVFLKVTTIAGDPPQARFQIVTEFLLPKELGGYDLSFGDLNGWTIRANFKDCAEHTDATVTGPAPLGGYWADSLLRITDQNGELAGIDLFGNAANKPDPDQDKAALYHHPWALQDPLSPHHPTDNPYLGTGIETANTYFGYPVFVFNRAMPGAPNDFKRWKLGDYLGTPSSNANHARPMRSGTTAITLHGGLTIAITEPSKRPVEAVPIDSVRSPRLFPVSEQERQRLLEAVIPIPGSEEERTIPIPGTRVFHMQVADPMVNQFPGDWHGSVLEDPGSPGITIPAKVWTTSEGRSWYTDGLNTIAMPHDGADPQSIWWPEQGVGIPKSRRFASAGHLQYVRTGVMPDPEAEARPLREQKGTPWRMLNFSPSGAASQKTDGGESYPDWALLDLFTAPAVFQPLGDPLPEPIVRTWGGATAGRINPNAILHPFGLARTRPLEALFRGVPVSTAYDASNEPEAEPVDAAALAQAVVAYLRGLDRPLMLPGEICNVPAVAACLYNGAEESRSRNDLVRQTVGNLTTRSNTFTVWAAGEAIRKKPGNPDHGAFEPGDAIVGRSRTRYVVERYLDPGSDGVYGNSLDPGPDGVVNTPDDPVTAPGGAHPTMSYPLPYRYRILSVSQVE